MEIKNKDSIETILQKLPPEEQEKVRSLLGLGTNAHRSRGWAGKIFLLLYAIGILYQLYEEISTYWSVEEILVKLIIGLLAFMAGYSLGHERGRQSEWKRQHEYKDF